MNNCIVNNIIRTIDINCILQYCISESKMGCFIVYLWLNYKMNGKLNCLPSEITFTDVAKTTSRLDGADGADGEQPQSGRKIPHQNETAN